MCMLSSLTRPAERAGKFRSRGDFLFSQKLLEFSRDTDDRRRIPERCRADFDRRCAGHHELSRVFALRIALTTSLNNTGSAENIMPPRLVLGHDTLSS